MLAPLLPGLDQQQQHFSGTQQQKQSPRKTSTKALLSPPVLPRKTLLFTEAAPWAGWCVGTLIHQLFACQPAHLRSDRTSRQSTSPSTLQLLTLLAFVSPYGCRFDVLLLFPPAKQQAAIDKRATSDEHKLNCWVTSRSLAAGRLLVHAMPPDARRPR